MKAEYQPCDAYPGNPFIDALPPIMMPTQLAEAITFIPVLPDDISERDSTERLSYTRKVYEAFIPLDYTPTIYNIIYHGILSSYRNKSVVEATEQSVRIGEAIERGLVPQTNTFALHSNGSSILGTSGMGKTTTINRILETIPQVIEHIEYHGLPFFCHQITYICIQCPSDCSVKAACFELLMAIDRLLTTDTAGLIRPRKNETLDSMVAKISQLCLTHHIGCIIIDEIQNILGSTNGGKDSKLIRFFVQLMNETGISIILVGTPEVAALFDASPHLMRRTRGPRITPITDADTFVTLASSLWQLQCVRHKDGLTDSMVQLLFDISGGIPARLAQLLCYSQEEAIICGEERLSEKLLKRTAEMHNMVVSSSHRRSTTAMKLNTSNVESQPKKGRPKAQRDSADLLAAFEEGISIEEFLEENGMLERLSEC